LEALQAEPILDLNMRLGEASGALMAVPILQMACCLHNEMATFAQAHITTGG
jgi:nicotinate-nucleotide--dimethylbenzimidazole phosphoribosyltransferase